MTENESRPASGGVHTERNGPPQGSIDYSTRLARRSPGLPWWLALLLVPLILAAIVTGLRHGSIQDNLSARTRAALTAHGINGADVSFSGRDGTITVPAGANAANAQSLVSAVDGVRTVKVTSAGTGKTPPVTKPGKGHHHTKAPQPTGNAGACSGLDGRLANAQRGTHKIEFAESSATITAGSAQTLNQIATLLKKCGSAHILVGGHTDNQGSNATSLPLSQRRAQAVRAALIQRGIAGKRVTAKGYGASGPIATNATAAGRAANRRVDITVK